MVTKPTPVVQALLDQMPSDEMKAAVLDLDMVQDIGPQADLEDPGMQQLADLQDDVLDLNEWTTDPAWAAAVATHPQLVQQLTDMFNGGTGGFHLYPQQLQELPNWLEVAGALVDIQLTFDL